mmetsp:Transcript_31678/g.67086  ORF Transcript_31678/g.67086 Transcript_31678/m.67086 type:complete len:416 (-) Transcript_31678:8-1255(-)
MSPSKTTQMMTTPAFEKKKKRKQLQRLIAGGTAGFVECSICHPLDTIKTRMQLRRSQKMTRLAVAPAPAIAAANSTPFASAATSPLTLFAANASASGASGPIGTARSILQNEGPLALYKGLSAVYTGIVPKMAIRFVSFEYYRDLLGGWHCRYNCRSRHSAHGTAAATMASSGGGAANVVLATSGEQISTPLPSITFLAGLLAGLTEAVAIVTPAEVCKIRMQSQQTTSASQSIKYKNVLQTATLLVREEGLGALYKGVIPTMLRQGCNQAVNFTVYNYCKNKILEYKNEKKKTTNTTIASKNNGENNEDTAIDNVKLDHWQSLLLGGLSGGMGPLVNNPLDVVKTRMQKQVVEPGKELKYKSLFQSCITIAKEEGTPALWKGITPRLMRIMPGQAITFMTYEAVSSRMEQMNLL